MDLEGIRKGGAFDVVEIVRVLAGEVAALKAGFDKLSQLEAGAGPTMDAGGQGAELTPPPTPPRKQGGEAGETVLVVQGGLRGLLNDRLVDALERAGFGTVASIAGATDAQLRAVGGVGPVTLREIRELIPAEK